MHEEAQSYRAVHPDGDNLNRNFASAKVTVDDIEQTVVFKNDPGGMHSEQRLIALEAAMTQRGSNVQSSCSLQREAPVEFERQLSQFARQSYGANLPTIMEIYKHLFDIDNDSGIATLIEACAQNLTALSENLTAIG